jgi:hypothetical protein
MGVAGRHFDQVVRELILQERPQVIAFASPFVGQRGGQSMKIAGRWQRVGAAPTSPDSIRPLMSFTTLVEMIADELHIKCTEWDEATARRAFLTAVPRKSKAIKAAVMAACRQRGWPCCDNHAGDALCIASYAFERLNRSQSHELTPLFQGRQPCSANTHTTKKPPSKNSGPRHQPRRSPRVSGMG